MPSFEKKKKLGGQPLNTRLKQSSQPVWRGPEKDGITFSLLSRFLVCRERFRLAVIEGLQVQREFNHRIEFGNMWHVCEEATALGDDWVQKLAAYCRQVAAKYPTQQSQVVHWRKVCAETYPIYLNYWEQHRSTDNTENLLAEEVFDVPYELPSGRVVTLRGKFDSVDFVPGGANQGVWLQENKTKGQIDQRKIAQQLRFDLQTMLYLVALDQMAPVELGVAARLAEANDDIEKYRVRGVRYNVVRRPLSGGKGTIKQRKATKNKRAETDAEYYERLGSYIKKEPDTYFMRWSVAVTADDIARFRHQCLDPILEQLYDWWEWVRLHDDPFCAYEKSDETIGMHWRHPYGVRNVLDEGGSSDLDAYLDEGDTTGLERIDTLFPELR